MKSLKPECAEALQTIIQRGGIIAYPTESVYGLGCDPFNETAVKKIAALKGRALDKGFLLIASDWKFIADLINPIPQHQLEIIKKTWPGPVTWVFPCSKKVPSGIRGKFNSVAIRLTNHPVAREICDTLKQAIVSTSANRAGEEPARSAKGVRELFSSEIDLIIEGDVGHLSKPTPIRDAITGDYLRI